MPVRRRRAICARAYRPSLRPYRRRARIAL